MLQICLFPALDSRITNRNVNSPVRITTWTLASHQEVRKEQLTNNPFNPDEGLKRLQIATPTALVGILNWDIATCKRDVAPTRSRESVEGCGAYSKHPALQCGLSDLPIQKIESTVRNPISNGGLAVNGL